jgi:hypothetical protein
MGFRSGMRRVFTPRVVFGGSVLITIGIITQIFYAARKEKIVRTHARSTRDAHAACAIGRRAHVREVSCTGCLAMLPAHSS